ncbi:MAG: RNA polymerase sigma factor [Kofleriaceae bacterium]
MDDLNEKTFGNQPRFGKAEREFVFAIARRIVGTPEAADDVAQEAMLLAYAHRTAFRGDSRYRTWLYRIAVTAALGHLRKLKRSRELLGLADDALPVPIDAAASPETQVADRQAAVVAERLLAELDPKYRDVVMMRTELSEAETARRLGITIANVKVRAHRARAQLRCAFERTPLARAA